MSNTNRNVGDIKSGSSKVIRFKLSKEPTKRPNGSHMISASCWCTSAHYDTKTGELVLKYVPLSSDKGKTVTKSTSVTFNREDSSTYVDRYSFTARVV